MGDNLIQMSSINFVRNMELRDNFQLQRLLNRMMWLKGKIEQSKKFPEQCLMNKIC